MSDYSVRPAQFDDIDSIAHVAWESWKCTYGNIYPEDSISKFVSSAYSKDNLRASISEDSKGRVRLFHVALNHDGKIVGFSHSCPENASYGSLEILRIYSLPETMGTGVGNALLNHLFEVCPDVEEISAWVEKRNRLGRAFYERQGFIVSEEEREDFFGINTTLLKYTLTR